MIIHILTPQISQGPWATRDWSWIFFILFCCELHCGEFNKKKELESETKEGERNTRTILSDARVRIRWWRLLSDTETGSPNDGTCTPLIRFVSYIQERTTALSLSHARQELVKPETPRPVTSHRISRCAMGPATSPKINQLRSHVAYNVRGETKREKPREYASRSTPTLFYLDEISIRRAQQA